MAKAGGSGEGAENTSTAIERALAAPVPDWAELAIEVDVRRSADGTLVAIHDERVDRTTNGRGPVRSLDWSRLRELSAGPDDQRIPLLAEVIEQTRGHELVVELHDADVDVARTLVRLLARSGAQDRERTIVASEHTSVVRAVRQQDPGLRTAATRTAAWCKLALDRVRLGRFAPHGHLWMLPEVHRGLVVVSASAVASAARAGDDVWVFVVDESSDVLRLRNLGVTGCFTTRPIALSRALRPSDDPFR